VSIWRYLLGRLVTGVLGLLVFASAVWVMSTWLVPGDFVSNFAQSLDARQEAALRAQLGLDRPLFEQWVRFMGGLLRLDLGNGYSGFSPSGGADVPQVTGIPVTEMVLSVLPWTVSLFALSIAIGLLVGLPLGRRIGWSDRSVSPTLLVAAMATAIFPPWLALIIANVGFNVIGAETYDRLRNLDEVLWDTPPSPVNVLWWMVAGVIVFGIGMVISARLTRLGRFPWLRWIAPPLLIGAVVAVWLYTGLLPRVIDLLGYIALPVGALALTAAGEVILVVAAAMAGTARAPYAGVAKAKGLSPGRIRNRHAGRATLLPAVSRLAASLPVALGGLVIVEFAFSSLGARSIHLEGLSSVIFFQGFQQRNTPLAVGAVIAIGFVALIVRLALDVIHVALDPRIGYEAPDA
jgi:ABC-type dipeptide/oligopeptide/nickel transport system permease component